MTIPPPDRPRARVAEARRNRQRLVEVATEAFEASDGTVPLEDIARAAGVGIATLYRHFPSRELLVEAVYEDQVARLRAQAIELLAAHRPAVALRLWGPVFLQWAVTKHGMADALRALLASRRVERGQMREQLVEVLSRFLVAGAAAGDLRSDVDAADVAAMFAGVLAVAGSPDQRDQATRMLDLIVDGLRSNAARDVPLA